jgi:hypothetical protein
MRKLTFLVLIIFICLSLGCSHKSSDEKISQDINQKIAADPQAQETKVVVETKEGKVTLKGNAKSPDTRKRVEEIAKEEPGVSSVDDEITVEPEETVSAPSPESSAVQQAAERTPIPPPPPPKPAIVPAGTVLTIRTDQALGSKTSQVGTAFTGSVVTPISVEGKMVIPAGAPITGTVLQAKKAGRMKGGAILALSVGSVTVKGHQYNVETEAFNQTSTGKGKRTAGMMVGGTGAGAAIGGLAGGGKGAAIGALVGAGAGTIGAMTGNRDITLPAESALNFRLVQPLTLRPDSNN